VCLSDWLLVSWIEACIGEEIPASVELEEGLRNGVVLAKLAHFITPDKVPLRKVYDKDLSRYNVSASFTLHVCLCVFVVLHCDFSLGTLLGLQEPQWSNPERCTWAYMMDPPSTSLSPKIETEINSSHRFHSYFSLLDIFETYLKS